MSPTFSPAPPTNDGRQTDLALLLHVLKVLNDQYEVTIAFCNAQTSLLNASTPSAQPSPGLPNSLDEYASCLRNVQDNWQQLQNLQNRLQDVSEYRCVETLYKAHVERTQRVLRTVQRAGGGVYSLQGISVTSNDSETVTVGLATLRASIDTIRDVLCMYLKE
uniref:Uncharacterized protein n=1 Tax=Amphora coffeiformis TaxID=265554 RepID=A0A7S3KXU5_9STRA|mmetsp:Transcript_7220/g.13781  ORF Transcript_7220/g.13781 Transcript_7220/m.13781 type:complete len:163 (+) Transcript_7220:111-599(+)|eukprot:scaffold244_cov172-Amphora_coffeaeformis.AAC.29